MPVSTNQKQARENFIQQIDKCWSEMYKLLLRWEELEEDDHDDIAEDYPLQESYDEWLCEFAKWIDTIKEKFTNEFKPTLTVAQLKKIIEKLDDHTQIVIAKPDNDWWLNIHALEMPDEEKGTLALVLYTKDNFSTIQF